MASESFGELDDVGFLREAQLFRRMPESVLRTILLEASSAQYGAGEVVVRRGDPGNSLFVVKSGVVEVIRQGEPEAPLAYLGRGECFGEVALLTDSPRNADIRVPERAELLIIEKALFEDLMANHPGFSNQLAVILAHRQNSLIERLPDPSTKKELSGNLRYFDLATVVQTLISSSQSGVMRLSSEAGAVAELYFARGNVLRAQYGHRTGDEAVHHLFQVQPQGEFHFSSHGSEVKPTEADPTITVPAMALMMESIRLQDELNLLSEQLPPEKTLVERAGDPPSWTAPDGADEAKSLWKRLSRPATIAELLEGSRRCRYHAAEVLLMLIEAEHVMPALHGGVSGGRRSPSPGATGDRGDGSVPDVE